MFADVLEPTPTKRTENLMNSLASGSKNSNIRKMSVQENEVRRYILAEYAREGTPPTIEAIQEKFLNGNSILRRLDELDFIYLNREKTSIECSYPFSSKKTIHQLEIDGVRLYSMCAIDALGVPFMLDRDVTIHSRCGYTEEPLIIRIENRKIVSRTHSDIWVWFSSDQRGKSADSCCKVTLFFTSEYNLDRWLEIHPREEGEKLTLPEAFFIGKCLFESRIR